MLCVYLCSGKVLIADGIEPDLSTVTVSSDDSNPFCDPMEMRRCKQSNYRPVPELRCQRRCGEGGSATFPTRARYMDHSAQFELGMAEFVEYSFDSSQFQVRSLVGPWSVLEIHC